MWPTLTAESTLIDLLDSCLYVPPAVRYEEEEDESDVKIQMHRVPCFKLALSLALLS
jgi:hypothetical protein